MTRSLLDHFRCVYADNLRTAYGTPRTAPNYEHLSRIDRALLYLSTRVQRTVP